MMRALSSPPPLHRAGLLLFLAAVLLVVLVPAGLATAAAKTIHIRIALPPTWAAVADGFGGQTGAATFPMTIGQPGTVLSGNGGTATAVTYQTMGFSYGSDEFYQDGEAKAAAWLAAAETQAARDPAGLRSVSDEESGSVVISGFEAFYARYAADESAPAANGARSLRYGRLAYYHIDLGGGAAVIVQLDVQQDGSDDPASTVGAPDRALVDREFAEAEAAVLAMRITGAGSSPSGGGGDAPWRTVAGGALAVAAAAAAIAGASLKTPQGRARSRKDPNAVVGYVLQLSALALDTRAGSSAPLTATAWRVRASGAHDPADDVIVRLSPPPGVRVDPAGGAGGVSTLVWRDGDGAQRVAPGAAITVSAEGPAGGTTAHVAVGPPAALDAAPDRVTIVAGTAAREQVRVWVDPEGTTCWTFSCAWERRADAGAAAGPAPAHAELAPDPNGAAATLWLAAPAAGATPPGESTHHLLVRAAAPGQDALERLVTVVIVAEGLVVDPVPRHPDGSYHVVADGGRAPKTMFFRALVLDPARGALVLAPDMLARLELEPSDTPGTPERNLADFAGLSLAFAGLTVEQPQQGRFTIHAERDVPGENPGEAYPVRMNAFVPGADPERFATEFWLGLVLSDSPTPAEVVDLERQRAQHVIDSLAPPALRPRLQALLDEQGARLGPEGMAELRRRIWREAADAVLAEGAAALESARFNDRIVYWLDNWVIWAGDLAFGALVTSYFGPYQAMAVTTAKPMLLSAVTALIYGRSPGEWLSEQIWSLLYLFEGRVMDVDRYQQLTGMSRAKCWALFCCYHFFKSLYQQKEKSIIQAVKDTAWQVSDAVIAEWLGKQVKAEMQARGLTELPAGAPPDDDATRRAQDEEAARRAADDEDGARRASDDEAARPRPDIAPEFDAPDPVDRAARMAEAIKQGAATGDDGRPRVDADTMEKIMRDADGARELKARDPKAWEAYDNARQDVYGAHDAELRTWISENVPDAAGQRVEVRTVGHADGVDRDYRAGIVQTDPVTGREIFIEIPSEKWSGESQRIFSGLTGGPADAAGAAEHARAHQQLATGYGHSEAGVDLADQGRVRNPETGRWEQTQITPNIEMVKHGESTLIDPEGVGRTYETKVANSYHTGATRDAYQQASKAAHTLTEVRSGYMAQDYKLASTPDGIAEGMRIIDRVAAGELKPAAADAELRAAKLGSGLPEFMERLSGQFAKLKQAHK
jgi:hypothetical protein